MCRTAFEARMAVAALPTFAGTCGASFSRGPQTRLAASTCEKRSHAICIGIQTKTEPV